MANVALDVPAGLVAPLRESAMLLYQASAESLHHTLETEAGSESLPGEVHEHRERLTGLDAVLAQLGWPGGAEAPKGLRVSGPPDLLQDIAYGALIDAGERLAAACQVGGASVASERIEALAREVIALDRLRGSTAR